MGHILETNNKLGLKVKVQNESQEFDPPPYVFLIHMVC